MTTYAYIKDNVVFNLAQFDGVQSPETLAFIASKVNADEIVLSAENCAINGTYTDGVFTLPPEPVVEEIVGEETTPVVEESTPVE